MTTFPARLMVLFAPDAPVAVVYRQGPHDRTQMWLWRTDTDEFTPGQWIKGRVDEHSTLSPDGQYVVSRVMRGDQHTVLSRPPFFSALAVSVKGLCLNRAHFLSDGRLCPDFNDWRALREQCPIPSVPWVEVYLAFKVDNAIIRSGEAPTYGRDQRSRKIAVHEGRIGVVADDETRWLIDLNPHQPGNVPPPDWTLAW